jgi:hypothetical protein
MTVFPQCFSCRHFRPVEDDKPYSCDAFPEAIPDQIIDGQHDHLKPYAGDHGIRYEPKPGAAHYPSV